jgi:hypothetical protein
MTQHQIPIWLHTYSLPKERQSNHYIWMNSPFLHCRNDENWATATDGKICVGVKLPYTGQSRERELPDPGEWVSKRINSFSCDDESLPLVDFVKLKADLANVKDICTACKSTGKAICDKCDGSTEITCKTCKGQGSQPCVTCSKPDRCKTCDGLGVVECKSCEEGKKTCFCRRGKEVIVKLGELYFNLSRLKKALNSAPDQGRIKIDKVISVGIFFTDNWTASLADMRLSRDRPTAVPEIEMPYLADAAS